jgi:8-oxo-dGTP pyrophosphatase MutT (NUDIX family)
VTSDDGAVAPALAALVARADGGPGPLALRDVPERWPVTASAELARGSLIRVRNDTVQMPGGTTAGREVVEHPGAVAIVALDDASALLMVRQYRHPTGHLLWEIPAGLRDVSGEPPQQTAARELGEETGYRAGHWHQLADIYSSPGFSNERIVIFLATDLSPLPAGQQGFVREHEEASMAVAWVPLAEAVAAVQAGDLHNGVTALGILSAYAALGLAGGALPRAGWPEG